MVETIAKTKPELKGQDAVIELAKQMMILQYTDPNMYDNIEGLFPKMHTIRESDHFAKRFDAGKKKVVMYNWTGRPYKDPQFVFNEMELTGYQEISIKRKGTCWYVHIGHTKFKSRILWTNDEENLIRNDGLTQNQFRNHFWGKEFKGYIYHWTDLRY